MQCSRPMALIGRFSIYTSRSEEGLLSGRARSRAVRPGQWPLLLYFLGQIGIGLRMAKIGVASGLGEIWGEVLTKFRYRFWQYWDRGFDKIRIRVSMKLGIGIGMELGIGTKLRKGIFIKYSAELRDKVALWTEYKRQRFACFLLAETSLQCFLYYIVTKLWHFYLTM